MENIKMSELIEGDVFCHELKSQGREAFLVHGFKDNKNGSKDLLCISRLDPLERIVSKKIKGYVVKLRTIL